MIVCFVGIGGIVDHHCLNFFSQYDYTNCNINTLRVTVKWDRNLFVVNHWYFYFMQNSLYLKIKNHIDSVMISLITSRAVDRGFEPWSSQISDYIFERTNTGWLSFSTLDQGSNLCSTTVNASMLTIASPMWSVVILNISNYIQKECLIKFLTYNISPHRIYNIWLG